MWSYCGGSLSAEVKTNGIIGDTCMFVLRKRGGLFQKGKNRKTVVLIGRCVMSLGLSNSKVCIYIEVLSAHKQVEGQLYNSQVGTSAFVGACKYCV